MSSQSHSCVGTLQTWCLHTTNPTKLVKLAKEPGETCSPVKAHYGRCSRKEAVGHAIGVPVVLDLLWRSLDERLCGTHMGGKG